MTEKAKVTPGDFFLWFGAMLTLYVSLFSFLRLVFDYLNYAFPDPLQYFSSDPYASGVSYEMASLLVLLPIFLILMRFIHRGIAHDHSRADVWVRRWALYLTLFLAAVTLAGDLITLIMYFFNGDVSERFLLKVLLIFLVAAGVFFHFFADLRGYWQKERVKARSLGWAVVVLVLITIGAGFLILGTPWQARLYRFDDQKVSDLQTIQSQIISYWQAKGSLPASLSDINDSISGLSLPTDAQSGQAYVYKRYDPLDFGLCATFNAVSQPYSYSASTVPIGPAPYQVTSNIGNDVWYHDAGQVCFDRSIDPSLYPPRKTTT